jgi:hypothetical protein
VERAQLLIGLAGNDGEGAHHPPPGPRQPSRSPASAIGAPSRSATCTERRVTPNANAVTAPHNAPRSSGGVVAAKRVRSTKANSPP